MNQQAKWIPRLLVIVAVAVGLISCGKQDTTTTTKTTSKTGESTQAKATLKLKGLYLGMSTEQAPIALKEKEPEWKFVITETNTVGSNTMVLAELHNNGLPMGTVAFQNNKAVLMAFAPFAFGDAMTKEQAMEPTDFVKQFVQAYNIPKMKPNDELTAWIGASGFVGGFLIERVAGPC